MKEKRTKNELHIAARNLQSYYGYFNQNIGYREAMERLKNHISGKRRDDMAYVMDDILFKKFDNVNYSLGY